MRIFNLKKFSSAFKPKSKQVFTPGSIINSEFISNYKYPQGSSFEIPRLSLDNMSEPIFSRNYILTKVTDFLRKYELFTFVQEAPETKSYKELDLYTNNIYFNDLKKIKTDLQLGLLEYDTLVHELEIIFNRSSDFTKVLPEGFTNEVIFRLEQFVKFLLRSEIINDKNQIFIKKKENRDILIKLGLAKKLFENINSRTLDNEQIRKLLPVAVVMNNVFKISPSIIGGYLSLINAALFDENHPYYNECADYFKIFVLTGCVNDIRLVLSSIDINKDIIFKNFKINDVLYLLTDLTYKVFSDQSSSEQNVELYNKFLSSVNKLNKLLSADQSINLDFVENFFEMLVERLLIYWLNSSIIKFIKVKPSKLGFSTDGKLLSDFLGKSLIYELLIEIERKFPQIQDLLYADVQNSSVKLERKIDLLCYYHQSISNTKNKIIATLSSNLASQLSKAAILTNSKLSMILCTLAEYRDLEISNVYRLYSKKLENDIKSLSLENLAIISYSLVKSEIIDINSNPYLNLFLLKV